MSGLFNNMGIDEGFIIILLMIICIVLVIMTMVNFNRMKKLERKYKSFMRGMDGASLEKVFKKRLSAVDRISDAQESIDDEMKLIHLVQDKGLTKYGIVKYDAFEDVGGKLSFVLALLDRNDTGIVLNAIHSKENCFLYIKEVVAGESYIMLSKEEIEALKTARNFGKEDEILNEIETGK